MLEIKDLTKTYYGGKIAVSGLSLDVQSGDIYGFIGHNGAGKTTTIKCIVGIQKFDAGDILIDGISIKEDPIRCKSMMAYIPDNPDVYEYLTGIQYLNFMADVYEVSSDDRKNRINELSEKFEISNVLNNKIESYSHGMRQKIVIIGALLHNPKLLILDEPTNHLDIKYQLSFLNIVKSLNLTIISAIHDLNIASMYCDRLFVMKNGRIVGMGTPQEVLTKEFIKEIYDIDVEIVYDSKGDMHILYSR